MAPKKKKERKRLSSMMAISKRVQDHLYKEQQLKSSSLCRFWLSFDWTKSQDLIAFIMTWLIERCLTALRHWLDQLRIRLMCFNFQKLVVLEILYPICVKYTVYIVMHNFQEAGEAIYREPWKENLSLIVSYKAVSSRVKN